MPEPKDPVRDAYTRISRILERLTPAERKRIHAALGTLFNMIDEG